MHVRAYNHWVSLLHGRAYPSIEDLDPANIADFGPHCVLLDFTARDRGSARSPISAARCARNAASTSRSRMIAAGAQPLAAVAADRPLSPDHRQSRADRLRGRVRRHARAQHDVSRHPDAVLVGRGHDRLHLWRDQLEGTGRRRDAGAARRRGRRRASAPRRRRRAPRRSGPTARAPARRATPRRRRPALPDDASPISADARARKRRRRCAPPTRAAAPRCIARWAARTISRSPPTSDPRDLCATCSTMPGIRCRRARR